MLSWERIPPLVRIPLKYGVLGGVLSIAFAISFYYLGKHPFLIPPFFDIRVLLIAIFLFFSLLEVRDYFFDGILFLWQGMAGSLIYLGIMASIGMAGLMAFGTYNPDFVEAYIAQGIAQIKSIPPSSIEQIGQQAVDEVLKSLPKTTLHQMALKYTGQTFAIGFFVMIIISVILRRQPKT
jgi:Protein of unknown function (DUF4199)